jgi:hypothetical protein
LKVTGALSPPSEVALRRRTEFALIVPIFLLIVAGLLAFGRVFFYWIEANHLASETARWAVVDQNGRPGYPGTTLPAYARNNATVEFRNNVNVCIDFPGKTRATAVQGDPVRVKVRMPFNFLPILGMGQINIRGTSTMRIENIEGNVPTYGDPNENWGTCT